MNKVHIENFHKFALRTAYHFPVTISLFKPAKTVSRLRLALGGIEVNNSYGENYPGCQRLF